MLKARAAVGIFDISAEKVADDSPAVRFDTLMSRLSSLPARAFGIVGLGRLDDIAGRGFGGIRRVFGKCGHLLSELGIFLEKFGVLPSEFGVSLFEFRDPSQIKLFLGRLHRPLHVRLVVVYWMHVALRLNVEEEKVLAKQRGRYMLRNRLRIGVLPPGALPGQARRRRPQRA